MNTMEPIERTGSRHMLIAQFWILFGFALFPVILGLLYLLPTRQPYKPDGIPWPPNDEWIGPAVLPIAAITLLYSYAVWLSGSWLMRLLVLPFALGIVLVLPGTTDLMLQVLPRDASRFLIILSLWWAARSVVAFFGLAMPNVSRWRNAAPPLAGCILAAIPLDLDSLFWFRLILIWAAGLAIEFDGFRLRLKSLTGPPAPTG